VKEINHSKMIRKLNDKFEEDNTSLKQTELEYQKVAQRQKHAKEHAKRLHEIATRNAPLTEQLKTLFSQMPDDLDELDEEIQSIALALSNMYEQDSSVIEEFKRCEEQLNSIKVTKKKLFLFLFLFLFFIFIFFIYFFFFLFLLSFFL
jgi:chromosome segregation ATPase